jgi:hypothetical protein
LFFFKDSDNEEFEALDKCVDEKKPVKNEGEPSKKEQTSNNKEEIVALPSTRKLLGRKRLNFKFCYFFV